jgi:carbonic anhydrase
MLLSTLLPSLLLASSALSCADHDYHSLMRKRADGPAAGVPSTSGSSNSTPATWTYEASYDWGRISPSFHLCQDGSTQAPIPLRTDQGLSLKHLPQFGSNYNSNFTGVFRNWGYGPAMTFAHPEGDYTTLPQFTFEETGGRNETVYMSGFHIHAPADHTVQGQRSRAEMHFVHVDRSGNPRAVLAFRIDPGLAPSPFMSSMPQLISYREPNRTVPDARLNPSLALNEVLRFNEFWTYKGESCDQYYSCPDTPEPHPFHPKLTCAVPY